MTAARWMGLPLLLVIAGCQAPRGAVLRVSGPAPVWPKPPDDARIRYLGEIRGQADLGAPLRGWDAVRAAIGGQRPEAQFVRPAAVAVDGERVYVADIGAGVVHILDLETREYRVTRGAPEDPLVAPVDVISLLDGGIAVVDRKRAAIDTFEANGEWRATLRMPEMGSPASAAWDVARSALWIVNVSSHECMALQNGRVIERIGGRGAAQGKFNFPSAVCWHPQVGLAVVDAMNFRVQVFDDKSQSQLAFGEKGDAAGDFSRPRDVAVDSDGHLYVLDNQFENVQIFDRDGRLLMAFGDGGDGPGQFAIPSGITIDAQDRIWIADSYNRRVQVFQYLRETP